MSPTRKSKKKKVFKQKDSKKTRCSLSRFNMRKKGWLYSTQIPNSNVTIREQTYLLNYF